MVSVLVSVGAVTWCGVMHRAALDKGPAGAERQEVATSCNSVRFGAQTSKGIRNPMLYPLELRALVYTRTAETMTCAETGRAVFGVTLEPVSVLVSLAVFCTASVSHSLWTAANRCCGAKCA